MKSDGSIKVFSGAVVLYLQLQIYRKKCVYMRGMHRCDRSEGVGKWVLIYCSINLPVNLKFIFKNIEKIGHYGHVPTSGFLFLPLVLCFMLIVPISKQRL